MLLYFDTCCLNRPHDDQRQQRIYQETEAIISLLEGVKQGSWDMVSSEVLQFEVAEICDITRRESIFGILVLAKSTQQDTEEVEVRAEELQLLGFKALDALHLASAEAANASLLLTTDDRLLRNAQRNESKLHVKVANPAKLGMFSE